MAFFNPLGAFSAAAQGAVKGYTEDSPKIFDMMGVQALGRAFQLPQGPIAPIPGIGQQGPQPPMPGQASQPPQPPQQLAGPPQPGPAQLGGPSMAPSPPAGISGPAGGPMPPQGGPMGGGGGPGLPQGPMAQGPMGGGGPPMGGPQSGQGMPQFDLQTLVQRIQQANPGLPPQAMVSALTRAVPLLNLQGKQDLMMLRQQMQQQGLDLRREGLEARERADDRRIGLGERREERIAKKDEQQQATGLSPEAIDDGAQRYLKTGQLPSLGWGAQARQDKAAILNKATQMRSAAGLPVDKMIKDQQKLKAEQVGIQRFMSGPQGNVTRSLGVVVDHLGTMRDLTMALENGDIQLFNRVRQSWLEQTGSELPTDVQAAAQIVGTEIIKALGVAGAGTEKERSEAANIFSTAKSPEQLRGAIGTVQPLLGGQLKGLRRQFISATGLPGEEFDAMIGSEAMKFLGGGQPRTEYIVPGQDKAQRTGDAMDAAKDKLRQGMGSPVTAPGGWSIQRVQ